MNITVTYNANNETIITKELVNVLPPEVAANAFLQIRNRDTTLNMWIPLGRLASVEITAHDLIQGATNMGEATKSKLALV